MSALRKQLHTDILSHPRLSTDQKDSLKAKSKGVNYNFPCRHVYKELSQGVKQ